MFEGFKNNLEETPKGIEQWPYFNNTPSSREFTAAKTFTKNHILTGKYKESELIDTSENVEKLKNYIEALGNRLMPGISTEGVINELRIAKVLKEPTPVEKKKKEKPVEFIPTNYVVLGGLKESELNEDQQKILEANLLLEELEKESIFKNPEELDFVYNKSAESQRNILESEEYYYSFSDAGLIKGGREEVKNDLEALMIRKKEFENREFLSPAGKEKVEKAKRIATITERALVHGVTERGWYGEDISIEPVSEFDDIKRGVDDILEIRKEDEESTFMGLGIDVTFRGLYSEQFKEKFFKLLQSIRSGHKTKVKYFRNHRNELMREFSIPKMVLYFNASDVKDMVNILKDEEVSDRENIQKSNVLNQIIQSCQILSSFAEESQNNIFRRYVAVLNSIKELGWKNKDVQEILNNQAVTDASKQLRVLVEEFKTREIQKQSTI